MQKSIKDLHAIKPSLSSGVLEEFKLLMDIEVESAVDDVDKYRWEYLRKESFSKYVTLTSADQKIRRDRAIEKWLGVERRNARTNIRLYSGETRFKFVGPDGLKTYSSEDVLDTAALIIQRVIGDEPDVDAIGNFSAGASTSLKRELGNAARKFTVKADVTPDAWSFVLPELLGYQVWIRSNPEVLYPRFVRGNELFTVPKTTEIDRVAAKEPDLNMWAQKRLGDQIRDSLRRFGINLNDQSINQRLAKRGSEKGGNLATLDLSSASDSMSLALVCRLLPVGWFVTLNALRSPETLIDGVWHENQMFSSMGNGFTFELESLLFYALARAVCALTRTKGRVSVYGDDIIAPVGVCGLLRDVLGFCGFVVNAKKSHWLAGDHFRESCGAHHYAGYDVKPLYVRRDLSGQSDLIHFLNSFRKWMDVEPFCHTISELARETWWRWAKNVDRRAWGGRDLDSRERLVTPHQPFAAWVEVRQKRERLTAELQTGLYLQTLRNTNRRESLPEDGSSDPRSTLTEGTKRFVLRRKRLSYWESVQSRPSW